MKKINFKRNLIYIFAILLAVALSIQTAAAHEILLEFPQEVNTGESVDIEISFGHFPDTYDSEHSHFTNLDEGILTIISPDGSKNDIDFRANEKKYYAAYQPEEQGLYWIVFNSTRDVMDGTEDGDGLQLRDYNAKAPLIVGDVDKITIPETGLKVNIVNEEGFYNNAGEEITLQLIYEGEAVSDQSLTVVDPIEQSQSLNSDEDGFVSFVLETEGRWMVHISNLTDENKSGEYQGQEYDRRRFNTALYIEVKEERGFLERIFN